MGAGTGATVGKILGPKQATKSGLGTASFDLGGGLVVGALVAVNAFGDVIDPSSGRIVAGARPLRGQGFADTLQVMRSLVGKAIMRFAGHTVLGVVATNARLNKEEVNKVAQMAHDGLARTVKPAHTMFDGDIIFALATGGKRGDLNLVGAYAAEAVSTAILCAVRSAESAGGLPACRDL